MRYVGYRSEEGRVLFTIGAVREPHQDNSV